MILVIKKSRGLDCILKNFFEELKDELVKPLVYIFNLLVNHNEFPLP